MADTTIRALNSIMRDGVRYGPGAPAGDTLTVPADEAKVLIAGGWAEDAPATKPEKESAKERKEREAREKAEADAAAAAAAEAEAAAKAAAENGGA